MQWLFGIRCANEGSKVLSLHHIATPWFRGARERVIRCISNSKNDPHSDVRFLLATDRPVRVALIDIEGRQIRAVVDNVAQEDALQILGTDEMKLSIGVYVVPCQYGQMQSNRLGTFSW